MKFSSIFEVVASNKKEALGLKAQADVIATICDMATQNGWSHVEVRAEGNHIVIKQANSRINQNRLSEAELIKGLDAHTAHADELFLNVDGELAEALIDQLNELELPFIVRSHKVSQEANGK